MALWLPIAAMIAGTLAANQGTRRVEKEQSRRMQAERLRQQALAQEADARLRETLATQERPAIEQQQRKTEARREAKYAQAAPSSATEFVSTPSAPREVKSEIAARMVDALARGRQQAKALARLGGRSDVQQQTGIDLTRSAQDLNNIGSRSRTSSSILPYELQDAQAKGEGWNTVSDIFNTLGTASLFYGMKKPPMPDYASQLAGGIRPL